MSESTEAASGRIECRILPRIAYGRQTQQMLRDISAAIATKDAAATITDTLESLREFPEVLIYDNGSTDETLDIVRSFDNTRITTGEFYGFGPTFNKAADLATHDWVFTIDADESISPELLASIKNVDLSNVEQAYAVHRQNYFMGKRIRYSGWGSDWLTRLYHREHFRHNDERAHPKILPLKGGKVVRLSGPMRHDAVRNVSEFLQKTDRYSEIARYNRKSCPPAGIIFLKSAWSFLRSYFIYAGFLDGWRGLVIAQSAAAGTFYKHIKIYADKKTGYKYRPEQH